ncbi:class E sortase [Cryobacterium sp. TMT2-18-3]|uniref:class E sortase n=1 Tax=unclassified Cryobacterium TaxID=2649013 RepID=UPI00106DC31E|nr:MULTISPECIES: class E sortase [unclassified Cryobacterium]TFC31475.1 class E sortase [Cryobacterium sp. TMT2-18-2]TFC37927.1 class E sortase [Cryobacterium sp. TMT2-42-4]TFC58038.1 class E sortase [Cryobacterium sp. TMT2-15-1]TFC65835.1 class E sortase [Cryobacterium sp. TMT2-18-3]
MSERADQPPAEATRHAPRHKSRPRLSAVGIIGELLTTAGILVLAFLGWQLWWNDMIMAGQQSKAAAEISQTWIDDERSSRDQAADSPQTSAPGESAPTDFGDPVVREAPPSAQSFAVLYVPRFGANYHRSIAEGIGNNVLNSSRSGIGHYPDTQMPGEVGNFALAAHRSANGGGMHLINELQLGDAIYVQTADGYYTYRFRDLEYVAPTAVDVIAPVPHNPDVAPVDRFITLTSCNPLLSTAERIIAYGVFEAWQPTSAGPPAEVATVINAQAQG